MAVTRASKYSLPRQFFSTVKKPKERTVSAMVIKFNPSAGYVLQRGSADKQHERYNKMSMQAGQWHKYGDGEDFVMQLPESVVTDVAKGSARQRDARSILLVQNEKGEFAVVAPNKDGDYETSSYGPQDELVNKISELGNTRGFAHLKVIAAAEGIGAKLSALVAEANKKKDAALDVARMGSLPGAQREISMHVLDKSDLFESFKQAFGYDDTTVYAPPSGQRKFGELNIEGLKIQVGQTHLFDADGNAAQVNYGGISMRATGITGQLNEQTGQVTYSEADKAELRKMATAMIRLRLCQTNPEFNKVDEQLAERGKKAPLRFTVTDNLGAKVMMEAFQAAMKQPEFKDIKVEARVGDKGEYKALSSADNAEKVDLAAQASAPAGP